MYGAELNVVAICVGNNSVDVARYPARPDAVALSDASFKMAPGTVTAVVGSVNHTR